jgi:hypothetical protein
LATSAAGISKAASLVATKQLMVTGTGGIRVA